MCSNMLRVPGLRREPVQKLYKELGIASVADLEDAARDGRLTATKGFGAAFQTKFCKASRSRAGGRVAISNERLPPCVSPPMRSPASTPTESTSRRRRGYELVDALSLVAADPHLHGGERRRPVRPKASARPWRT